MSSCCPVVCVSAAFGLEEICLHYILFVLCFIFAVKLFTQLCICQLCCLSLTFLDFHLHDCFAEVKSSLADDG